MNWPNPLTLTIVTFFVLMLLGFALSIYYAMTTQKKYETAVNQCLLSGNYDTVQSFVGQAGTMTLAVGANGLSTTPSPVTKSIILPAFTNAKIYYNTANNGKSLLFTSNGPNKEVKGPCLFVQGNVFVMVPQGSSINLSGYTTVA